MLLIATCWLVSGFDWTSLELQRIVSVDEPAEPGGHTFHPDVLSGTTSQPATVKSFPTSVLQQVNARELGMLVSG